MPVRSLSQTSIYQVEQRKYPENSSGKVGETADGVSELVLHGALSLPRLGRNPITLWRGKRAVPYARLVENFERIQPRLVVQLRR